MPVFDVRSPDEMHADLPVNPYDRKRQRSSRLGSPVRLLKRGPSFDLRLAILFPSTSGTAKHLVIGAGNHINAMAQTLREFGAPCGPRPWRATSIRCLSSTETILPNPRLSRGAINFGGHSLVHNSPSVEGARHVQIDFDPNFSSCTAHNSPNLNLAAAEPGSFTLSPDRDMTKAPARDYTAMSGMIFGKAPNLDEVLKPVGYFESQLNAILRRARE